MYRALFLADLHISNSLPYAQRREEKSPVTDRLVDTLAVLDEVADYAERNKVRVLYVVGDLLDRRLLDAVTLKFAKDKIIELVDDRELEVILVPGNHEAFDAAGSAYTLEGFAGLRGQKLRVWGGDHSMASINHTDGGKIVGLPYKPEEVTRATLQALDLDREETIVLLHQSLKGGKVGEWVCPDGISAEDLAGFKYTIAGHFHSKQVLPCENAMYLGAPLQHNFGDAGDVRGFWDVTFGNRVRANFVETAAPKFHALKFAPGMDLEVDEGDYVQLDVVGTSVQLRTMLQDANHVVAFLKESGARLVKLRPLLIAEKKDRLQLHENGRRITWPAVVEGYLDGCDLEGLERRRLEDLARAALLEAEMAR